jgi:hypothetical protein
MKKALLLSLFFFLLPLGIYAKGGNEISVEYAHSFRIEYNPIIIKLKYVDSAYQMNVQTKQLEGYNGYEYSNTEKVIAIDEEYFDTIYDQIVHLPFEEIITKSKNLIGADGTTIKIKIGAPAAKLELTVWTPNHRAEERKTEELNAILKELFTKAGLEQWLQ